MRTEEKEGRKEGKVEKEKKGMGKTEEGLVGRSLRETNRKKKNGGQLWICGFARTTLHTLCGD